MPEQHKLYPLGLWCSHHYSWLALDKALEHRRLAHTNCDGCQNEADLGLSLLDEAAAILRATGKSEVT